MKAGETEISQFQTKETVKAMSWGVSLASKIPGKDGYKKSLKDLTETLRESGNNIIGTPEPFYKKGSTKNPAGYVIKTDKEVMVCYHGTQFNKLLGSGAREAINDLRIAKSTMQFGDHKGKVHTGFKIEYELSKDSLMQALDKVNTDDPKPLHISGHSLGGAVAQIAALDLTTNAQKKVSAVTTFGGPRVFSKATAQFYTDKELSNKTLRVKIGKDPVPRFPLEIFDYGHVGFKINVTQGFHSGADYRKNTDALTHEDINSKKESSLRNNSIKDYMKAVKRTPALAFSKIRKSTKSVIDKSNQLKKALIAAATKKALSTLSRYIATAYPLPKLKKETTKQTQK